MTSFSELKNTMLLDNERLARAVATFPCATGEDPMSRAALSKQRLLETRSFHGDGDPAAITAEPISTRRHDGAHTLWRRAGRLELSVTLQQLGVNSLN